MHKQQQKFCESVKKLYPTHFKDGCLFVIDFGSLDINGNNRYLFKDCVYVGVDLGIGKNVTVVSKAHEYFPPRAPDVIISTEMLEHDIHWKKSVRHMVKILRPGGLLVITCASDGRAEHGTLYKIPADSPFTLDYYKNISIEEFREVVGDGFSASSLTNAPTKHGDLLFWGIKNGG